VLVLSSRSRRPHAWVGAVIVVWITATTYAFGALDASLDGLTGRELLVGAGITSVLALPLLGRHRWPRTALVVLALAIVALAVTDVVTDSADSWLVSATVMALPALGVAGHSAVLEAPRGGVTLSVLSTLIVVAALVGVAELQPGDDIPVAAALVGTSWATGLALLPVVLAGQRREQDRRRALEAEMRQELARLAVARDLHDDVGHHLAAIRIQAVAGRHVSSTDAHTTLERIAEVSDTALSKVEDLVTSLRDDRPADDAVTLPDIAELCASMRHSGVECALHIDTGAQRLDPTVEAVARRIVQEALTNVLRHADAARVDVVLRRDGRDVVVDITDDGSPLRKDAGGLKRSGRHGVRRPHGITGMRERVQLLGGHLVAGPQPVRGWRVEARLPLAGTATVTAR